MKVAGEGTNLTFTADDGQAGEGRYVWSYGDGIIESGGDATATHEYKPGHYVVRVELHPEEGESTSESFSLVVPHAPAKAEAAPEQS